MNTKIIVDLEKLHDRSDEVNLKEVKETVRVTKIINELKDILREEKDLVALAAPQLGYKDRIFCIKFANGDIRAFINPLVFANKGFHLSREVPIGINNIEYIIPRASEVHAAYQTPIGKNESNAFKGAVGEVFQQMIQLLDGVTLDEIGLEILEGFDDLNKDERRKIIEMYLTSLKNEQKELEKEINNDSKLSSIDASIDIMKKINLGQLEVTPLTEEQEKSILNNRGKN